MDTDFDTTSLEKFCNIRDYHTKIYLANHGHLLTWKPKERILDIGCGTGDTINKFLYPLLPEDFSQLLCTDISKDMIQATRKLLKGKPKVSYDVLDIGSDLDDGMKEKFDHIFSFYCLMWIKDQRKVFKNIYDLLSPDGECFFVIVGKHNIIDLIFEVLERPRWMKFNPNPVETYPHPYQRDSDSVTTITEYMKSAGFSNIHVYLEASCFTFQDEEEFLGFFKALPNPLALMTPEEQTDYLREAVEIANAKNLINAGESKETSGTFLVVYGRK